MGWDGRQYELRAFYLLGQPGALADGEVAGIDVGEIHPAVAHDGTEATILNGRYLRSVRRYQNKLKARLAALRDRKKRRSHRHKRMVGSMRRQLRRLDHQIKDLAHKQTSRRVSTLHERGVQTVAIGDMWNFRKEYLGGSPVVGAMASPSGVRYHAHMRCSTLPTPAA